MIEGGAQLDQFRLLLLGRERLQVQLVVHLKFTGLDGLGDAGLRAFDQGLQVRFGSLRQGPPLIVGLALFLPSISGNKQPFAAAKRQAVVDPHSAITQGSTQREQGGDFEGAKRLFTIGA